MKLSISLELPDPSSSPSPVARPSLEEQVREAVQAVESGYESRQEWKLLRSLHQSIKRMGKKAPTRAKNILGMIEPVLRKYGYIQ